MVVGGYGWLPQRNEEKRYAIEVVGYSDAASDKIMALD
jgi:hypothetical protein